MFIKTNDKKYEIKNYINSNDVIFTLEDKISKEDIGDTIEMYSSDEIPMFLTSFNTSDYDIKIEVITEDKSVIILAIPKSLEEIKTEKITQLDSICTDTIYKGTDILLSTGETQHFTLDEQDQANLAGIGLQLGAGAEMISWHQDDVTKPCQFYSAEDAQTIINTLTVFKSYHITYFRDLRIYVNSLENIEDVEAIYYGYALPDEAKSDVLKYYERLIMADKAVE